MKSGLKEGKRFLSILMAVLMVMTTWVFVAPEKADAATAGKYDFKVEVYITNDADWHNTSQDRTCYGYMYGRNNNGKGTSETKIINSTAFNFNRDTKKTYQLLSQNNSNYFPTRMRMDVVVNKAKVGRRLEAKFWFYVKKSGTSDWKTLPITGKEIARNNFARSGHNTINNNSEGSVSIDYENNYDLTPFANGTNNSLTIDFSVKSDNMPYPNSIEWDGDDLTIKAPVNGADGSATTTKSATVKDQYGVEWYKEPSWSVHTGSSATQTSNATGASGCGEADKGTIKASTKVFTTSGTGGTRTLYYNPYILKSGTTYVKGTAKKVTVYNTVTASYKYYTSTLTGTVGVLNTKSVEVVYEGTPTKPTVDTSYYDYTNHYSGGTFSDVSTMTSSQDIYMTYSKSGAHSLDTKTPIDGKNQHRLSCGCGYYKDENHLWNGWITTTDPTCIEKGQDTNTCSVCGEKKYQPIAMVEHRYNGDWVFDPATKTHSKKCTIPGGCGLPGGEAVPCSFTSKVTTKPTCTKPGVTTYTCTVCGGQYTENTPPATDHKFTDYVYNHDATCYADGTETAQCDNIDENTGVRCTETHTRTRAGTQRTHDMDWIIDKQPTCTEKGSKHWGCKYPDCDYREDSDVEIDLALHTWGEWVIKEDSTCSEKGVQEHTCKVCGYSETSEVQMKPHTYETGFTIDEYPTCTKNGEKSRHCANCYEKTGERTDIATIPALGHDMKKTEDVPASCIEGGYERWVCQRVGCGHEDHKKTSEPLGHDPKEYHYNNDATCQHDGTRTSECLRCGVTYTITYPGTKLEHTFTNYVYNNDATCTKDGTQTATCSACDPSYAEPVTHTKKYDALGHEYRDEDYVYNNDATCYHHGTMTAKCVRFDECHTTNTKDDPDHPKLSHNFGPWITTKHENCTENGSEYRICTNAGCSYRETRVRPALGHIKLAPVQENIVPETCTTDGSYNNVVYCGREGCTRAHGGTPLETTKIVVEKLGHDYAASVIEVKTAPTCTMPGQNEKVQYCKRCDYRDTIDGKIVVPELGHESSGEWTITKQESCTKKGEEKIFCTRCTEEEYAVRERAPLGHNIGEPHVVKPTCTTRGYTVIECKGHVTEDGTEIPCDRNYSEITDYVDKIDHVYKAPDDYEVIEEATCSKPGSKQKVSACEMCGKEQWREIVEIPALDHTPANPYITEDSVKPTCITDGYNIIAIDCTVCKTKLSRTKEIVKATGHTEGDTKDIIINKATCTEKGSHDEVLYCKVCKMEMSRTHVIDEATGHEEGEAVIENNTASTCGQEGSYDTVIYCTKCHEELSRVTTPVGKLDHIGESDVWVTDFDSTCYAVGLEYRECTACHERLEERDIPMKEHSLDDGTVTEPTCSEKGYTTYKCQNEGCTYSCTGNEVEMISHSYKSTVTKPTCITEGFTTHECTECGHSYIDTPVEKEAHQFGQWKKSFEGTCVKPSTTSRFCIVCQTEEKIEGELGTHVEKVIKGTAATCDNAGLTDGVVCSECGTVLTEQKTIAALGHRDNDQDHKCDNCKEPYEAHCDCICHKESGIMKLMYSILRTFWKLFKVSKECYCGAEHY